MEDKKEEVCPECGGHGGVYDGITGSGDIKSHPCPTCSHRDEDPCGPDDRWWGYHNGKNKEKLC